MPSLGVIAVIERLTVIKPSPPPSFVVGEAVRFPDELREELCEAKAQEVAIVLSAKSYWKIETEENEQ